ncbi:MAG TPA: PIN domain-containing protein [Thermoanaerobaculia bacterium]|nr:PIN domain-containing protein [Thermoanaerobaculia bacterium]
MRSLVDTNLLIYAYDLSEPVKRERAVEVIQDLAEARDLVLSVQVLNEFASVALRKKDRLGKPHSQLGEIVGEFSRLGQVLPLTPGTTRKALVVVERHQLSFWDALLWAVASDHSVAADSVRRLPAWPEG